jgi:hypothetical protein
MINDDGAIPPDKLSYFRERLRNRLHELVLLEFLRQEDTYRLTKKELAERIGRRPEQVIRWLGTPGNWTLDTVSDLLLGMASEPDFAVVLLTHKIVNISKQSLRTVQERPASGTLSGMASPPSLTQPNLVSGTAELLNTTPTR